MENLVDFAVPKAKGALVTLDISRNHLDSRIERDIQNLCESLAVQLRTE